MVGLRVIVALIASIIGTEARKDKKFKFWLIVYFIALQIYTVSLILAYMPDDFSRSLPGTIFAVLTLGFLVGGQLVLFISAFLAAITRRFLYTKEGT